MNLPNHSSSRDQVDLSQLLAQFYAASQTLAEFRPASSLPTPFAQLLDHHSHMTVTVEDFHGDLVDVVVHRSRSVLRDGSSVWQNDPKMASDARLEIAEQTVSYAREITLVTQRQRRIVQYGLVRLDVTALQREVWLQIASGEIPLGRVLIEHNVLREVELCRLWEVQAGIALSSIMQLPARKTVYGRTALIHCDQRPAIELLEIVS